jgi:hypothetical protein
VAVKALEVWELPARCLIASGTSHSRTTIMKVVVLGPFGNFRFGFWLEIFGNYQRVHTSFTIIMNFKLKFMISVGTLSILLYLIIETILFISHHILFYLFCLIIFFILSFHCSS